MTISQGPPLARLLAVAHRSLVDGLQRELRARGWADVRPSFGYVLVAARDGPTTATALAGLLGTSKQATSKLVDAMEAAGYVRRRPGAGDGRQRPVELTRRGLDLLAAVEEIYAQLEREWADVIGLESVERLRADLVAIATAPDSGQLRSRQSARPR